MKIKISVNGKMDQINNQLFEKSPVTENEDESIAVSNKNIKVTLQDGSSHILPVINIAAMEKLQERRSSNYATAGPSSSTGQPEGINGKRKQLEEDKEGQPITKRRQMGETISTAPIISLSHLYKIIISKESTMAFLKEKNLLASCMDCNKCGTEMRLRQYNKVIDSFIMYCPKYKCKHTSSIRNKSFFSKTKISLEDVLKVIYLWATGVPAFICQRLIPEVCEKTINDWYSFCRDICMENLKRHPVQFDNEEVVVTTQIDESIFGKKQKYHKGKYFKRTWFFGISDQKQHKCYIEAVEKRDCSTLEGIILKHVKPNTTTTIVSDGWAAYNKLEELGYKHEVVIHEKEFVNNDGFHTNSIESIWSQVKAWFISMKGVKSELYPSYLAEFMYRYNYAGSSRGQCLEKLFEDIAEIYKV